MKKLLFWGLTTLTMLLSMFGPVRAQGTETPETPVTLSTPSFKNPGNVQAGAALEIAWPEDFDNEWKEKNLLGMAFILYVENDDDVTLELSGDDANVESLQSVAMMGGADFKVGYYDVDEEEWYAPITLSGTGEVKVRARLAASASMTDELVYSDEFTATYTVTAAPKPNAPTFYVAGVKVEASTMEVEGGAEVSFVTGYEETEKAQNIMVFYAIDGSDADFEDINVYDLYDGTLSIKMYDPEVEKVTIEEDQTIKAATAEMNGMTIVLSDIVTVAFTVKAVEVEPGDVPAPVFSPDGGAVESGAKVLLTNGTENGSAPLPIYYNLKTTGSEEFDKVSSKAELKSALSSISKKLIAYPAGGIELTAAKTINAATADTSGERIVWSPVVTKEFTIGTVSGGDGVAAPVFSPDGGEIEAEGEITITTSTPQARIYYALDAAAETFTAFGTGEALDAEEENSMPSIIRYYNSSKPTLADLGVETPGAKASVSAAAALVADDGGLTWSAVTVREFTVAGGETPVVDVEAPVITPGNDATVHMGDSVRITCGTPGAKVYYTANGKAPYTMDGDGYPVAVAVDSAFVHEYTEPFALTEDMLIRQGSVWALKIRAIAVKDNGLSGGAIAGYVVYPDAPVFSVPAGAVDSGTRVEIACNPTVADIYYTTDGTAPTMEDSPRYTDTTRITVTEAMTVRAVVVLGQYQSSGSAAYTIKGEDPVEPTLTVRAEGGVLRNDSLVFADGKAAFDMFVSGVAAGDTTYRIYVNVYEGDEVAPAVSLDYDFADSVRIEHTFYNGEYEAVFELRQLNMRGEYANVTERSVVFKVTGGGELPEVTVRPVGNTEADGTVVFADGKAAFDMFVSGVAAGDTTYRIYVNVYEGDEVAPAVSLDYDFADSVRIGHTFYNGEYEASFELRQRNNRGEYAYVAGETVRFKVTENVGNDVPELAGVRLYPNPTEGDFSVEAPVEARVEIFSANGMLVKAFTMAAGVEEVRLSNSGIYFVRLTAGNGQVAVKRVVVR
ncbi:MAG: chitobiase/beta-hexosaminidase C-terminal domain-containing protein [Ruminococcus flavefaciens]|nr:chitobiase/beta-hexosaminidase C-terminal domain-containing protein [Ruminococcus flavefaciens]